LFLALYPSPASSEIQATAAGPTASLLRILTAKLPGGEEGQFIIREVSGGKHAFRLALELRRYHHRTKLYLTQNLRRSFNS